MQWRVISKNWIPTPTILFYFYCLMMIFKDILFSFAKDKIPSFTFLFCVIMISCNNGPCITFDYVFPNRHSLSYLLLLEKWFFGHIFNKNDAPWGIFLKTHKCFDFEPPSQDRESRMLDRATPTGLNLFGSHMIWYSLQINVRNLLIHRLISVEPTRSRLLPLATNPIRLFKFYLGVAISIYEKDYSA